MAVIPRPLVDEMVAHSLEDLPNEACGVILAVDGVATAVHRVPNAAASPYRYVMDDEEQLKLQQRLDESKGEETLFAIYHSHVASEARPSQTDVNMAFWPPGDISGALMYPDAIYIVVSLAEEGAPVVQGFHIIAGDSYEACLEPVELHFE
ncbi:MAG: M67 family metallopeptidase [Dehalococcoidia bacterium]|jgi:proteasome lid subunit RPN8/RPN11|nr:M67 family metallopeptidase [Dehalococcoidia bacterium]